MIEPCKNKASINSAICHHHRPSAAVPIFTCYYCFQISMNCPNFHLLLLYQISIFFWTKCIRSLWDAAWTAVSVFCALCLRSRVITFLLCSMYMLRQFHRHLFSSAKFQKFLLISFSEIKFTVISFLQENFTVNCFVCFGLGNIFYLRITGLLSWRTKFSFRKVAEEHIQHREGLL